MQEVRVDKMMLSPLNSGCCCSYELSGDFIIVRWLGILPIRRIALWNVRAVRLAERDEASAMVYWLNWVTFYLHRSSYCPIYAVETKRGRCYYMKLPKVAYLALKSAVKLSKSVGASLKQQAA